MDSKQFLFTARKDGFKTYDEAMEWGLATGNAYSKDSGLIPERIKIEVEKFDNQLYYSVDGEQRDDFIVCVEFTCVEK